LCKIILSNTIAGDYDIIDDDDDYTCNDDNGDNYEGDYGVE